MQFHATYNPKQYVASFLSQHYKGRSVQIIHGCCRKCLKHGEPVIHNLETRPWSSLLADGTIDPYQAAGVFFPGSQFHSAHFKKPILDPKAPELPCKYPATCEQTCFLCTKYIDGSGVELKDWPGFQVHAQCTTRCQHLGCQTRLPDFPAYISYQRSQFVCEEHQLTRGFQRMAIGSGAFTPALVSKSKKEVKAPSTHKPTPLPSPKKLPEEKRPDTRPDKRPDTRPDTRPDKRPDAPQPPKKTVHFKKPLGKAKADKYNGDKSQFITNFFPSPNKTNKAQPSSTEEPRRFIRNKQGIIYAYWKGESAHCIDTDAVLFKRNFSGRRVNAPTCKLDFSPPVRLDTFDPIPEDITAQDKTIILTTALP